MSQRGAPSASQALLTAALGGLLCLTTYACTDDAEPGAATDAGGVTGSSSSGGSGSSSGGSSSSGHGSSSGAVVSDAGPIVDAAPTDATFPDVTPVPTASYGCDGGVAPDPHVTGTSTVPSYPLEQFNADCTERGGTVQIEPHCGGSNGCRGMSYDTGTQTLTENTCRGTNTCAGYSCIDCD